MMMYNVCVIKFTMEIWYFYDATNFVSYITAESYGVCK